MSDPTPLLVGIDAGGTWLRVALVGDDPAVPQVVHRAAAPTNRADFAAAVGTVIAEHRQDGAPVRVGCAIAGLVSGTTCRWVPNLPFLDGVDLAELFAPFGVDAVAAGNDAQLSLLAERDRGAAADVDDVVLLAIGTGIGSAVLVDGRIVRGVGGGACSFGWATLDAEASVDVDGDATTGWLEGMAAGRALDALAVETGIGTRGDELIAAARAGHADAVVAVGRVARVLGAALVGVVGLLAPARVVITGGVASSLDTLRPPLLDALRSQLPAHLRGIEVVAGRLGPDAALLGALVAAAAGPTWWASR